MATSNPRLVAGPRGHTVISCGYRGPSTPRPVATATGFVAQDDTYETSARSVFSVVVELLTPDIQDRASIR